MADQADPIELAQQAETETDAEFKARLVAANIDDMRAKVGEYAQVKDLVLQPGWPVLIHALEKRSAHWKQVSMDLLEAMLIKNDGSNNAEFSDARVHYRAAEEAILILLIMRRDAKEAQEILDKASAAEVSSTQKG